MDVTATRAATDVSMAVYQPNQNWAHCDLYSTRRVVFDTEWQSSLAQPLLSKNFMMRNGFVKVTCFFLLLQTLNTHTNNHD